MRNSEPVCIGFTKATFQTRRELRSQAADHAHQPILKNFFALEEELQ